LGINSCFHNTVRILAFGATESVKERQIVRFSLNAAIIAIVVLSASLSATGAFAAYREIPQNRDVVYVTPEGDLLEYIPSEGQYDVRTDRNGYHIFIDRFGIVVATEVPASLYFQGKENGLPGGAGFDAAPLDDSQFGVEQRALEDVDPNADPNLPSAPNDNPDLAALDPNQPALPEEDPLPTFDLKSKSRAEMTALQTFLDREGASPGVIDGKMGSNVTKAIVAWQEITGETLDPKNTDDILERLRLSGGLAITDYTISAADAAGPYVAEIPEDYAQKAALPAMSFTSTTEALAERFHMDEAYLKELNKGVDFTQPGVTIKVVDPGQPKTGTVARIVANKRIKMVQAFDESGTLIAAYPASIGSSDTPSPSGTHAVARVALDPNYTYNPKINFQQGNNDKILTLPPGPNGPVGTVWIALDKPTYGIHGTPEPSKIGKTQSHGCVRLTNWDARELAGMVKPGVIVQFVD
jgi:lipoprotein-anchoring transpeptidase ErfK/SrfK